jgi:hypothetical protein
MVLAFATMYGQTTFLFWEFDQLTTAPYTHPVLPDLGTGTIQNFGAGLTNGQAGNGVAGVNPATGGNTGFAYNTSQYPAPTATSATHGIQIMASTAGLSNIELLWYQQASNTGANRYRLMYTIDGTNFVPFVADATNATNVRTNNGLDQGFDAGLYTMNLGTTWLTRTADFTAIPEVNDNPNFGIRILAAHPSTGNSYVGANGNYGSGGTTRYDKITFTHTPANPLPAPIASYPGGIYTTQINVELSCIVDEIPIDDVTFFYTTDGSDPTESSTQYSTSIPIAVTTTLKFFATKLGFGDSPIVTVVYRFPVEKEDIVDLKTTATPGTGPIYKLNSDLVVTHTFFRTNRMQYYVQDLNDADVIAAILIDDPLVAGDHVIDPPLVVGDVISGIVGEYTVFNGMHQFTPVLNTTPDEIDYEATPVVATLQQISTNLDIYQAKLVQVENVIFFPSSTAPNFTVQNLNYAISDGTANYTFRTYFTGADYLGSPGIPIPFSPVNLTGVISSASGNPAFITARNIDDFDIQSADLILPPKNLTATVDGVDVTLNWDPPVAPGPYFTHAVSDAFYSSVGPEDAPGGYTVVHRFTPAELIEMGVAGHTLSSIEIMVDDTECGFELKVWIGGTWSDTIPALRNHGTLVRSQPLDFCPEIRIWVPIDLDEPVTIPTNRELWIGFYGLATPGFYPAATDSGPANHGSGNIFQIENQWLTMYEYDSEYDHNWMIRGVATDINTGQPIIISRDSIRRDRTAPPVVNRDLLPNISLGQSLARTSQPSRQPNALLGYNVYRDGEIINFDLITETTYFDDNLENDTYEYTVTAVYTGDRESLPSIPSIAIVEVEIVYNPPHSLEAQGGDGLVELEWVAPKNHEFSADFLEIYNIYRNDVLLIAGHDEVTFTDNTVVNGVTYTYKVTAVYVDHIEDPETRESIPSNTATATPDDSSSEKDMLAIGSRLHGNYPNPFNPITTLQFTVDSTITNQHVTINIYNIRGQLVRSLVNGEFETGDHTVVWNGTDDSGRGVSSGIYFYRMTTNSYSATRKMILMK